MPTKTPNYTEKQADRLVALYGEFGSNDMASVQAAFNQEFDCERTVPSLRGKLMSIQDADGNSIYVPMDKVEKVAVDKGPTKKERLIALDKIVGGGFDVFKLQGATKTGIEDLTDYITGLQAVNE